jgi:DNA-binding MarR family transcriptional regulator
MRLNNEHLSRTFLRIDERILQTDLDFLSKGILSLVLSYHVEGKKYFGGHDSMARYMGVSRSTVKRKLKDLECNGYLCISLNNAKEHATNIVDLGDKAIKLFTAVIQAPAQQQQSRSIPTRSRIETPIVVDEAPKTIKSNDHSPDRRSEHGVEWKNLEPKDQTIWDEVDPSKAILTSMDAMIPIEVFKHLSYNPKKGKDVITVDDAVRVLELYGVSPECTKRELQKLERAGWSSTLTKVKCLQRVGEELLKEGKRVRQPKPMSIWWHYENQ